MGKLIRAEWYRLSHSSKLMIWAAFMIAIMILLPYVDLISMVDDKSQITGTYFLYNYMNSAWYFIVEFFTIFVACLVAMNYTHKTAYYEAMHGNKTDKILISKLIVDGIVGLIVFVIATFGTYAYYCIKNGVGTIDDDWDFGDFAADFSGDSFYANPQTLLRVFLFIVLILHLILCSILIVTSIKAGIGILCVWLRWAIFESICGLIVMALTKDMARSTIDKIEYLFIQNRLMTVGDRTVHIGAYQIVMTFAMLILEVAFWYAISRRNYKKQVW